MQSGSTRFGAVSAPDSSLPVHVAPTPSAGTAALAPVVQHGLRGMFLVLVAAMLFTSMDTITKYLVRHYPVGVIMWIRFVVQNGLFALVVLPRFGLGVVRTQRLGIHLVRGGLLIGASFLFATSLRFMPLAEVTAIAFIAPILLTVLAVFFLKERVELGSWVAIGCAFLGVLVIIRPGSDVFHWAALLPLSNALLFAIYQVLTRKLSGLESPLTLIFYPGLVGLAGYSFTWLDGFTFPSDPWHLTLMVAGGALSLTSHLVLIKAFQYAPASRLAPFSYTQLVWVTLAGLLVFGNFPDALSLLGIGVLIASGVYCANHQRRSERESRAELLETPTGD